MERRSAKIEGNAEPRDERFGEKAYQDQIDGADRGDARQDVVDVFGRALARANAGDETAVLLQCRRCPSD